MRPRGHTAATLRASQRGLNSRRSVSIPSRGTRLRPFRRVRAAVRSARLSPLFVGDMAAAYRRSSIQISFNLSQSPLGRGHGCDYCMVPSLSEAGCVSIPSSSGTRLRSGCEVRWRAEDRDVSIPSSSGTRLRRWRNLSKPPRAGVSIPSSSGTRLRRGRGREVPGRAEVVSIPSSSGTRLRPREARHREAARGSRLNPLFVGDTAATRAAQGAEVGGIVVVSIPSSSGTRLRRELRAREF